MTNEGTITKIVGISGTPVENGNCDKAVQAALESASLLPGVQTEFISLAGKKIAACKHCQYCIDNMAPCNVNDDANWIIDKMAEADGLILGAPVWTHTIPPHRFATHKERPHPNTTPEARERIPHPSRPRTGIERSIRCPWGLERKSRAPRKHSGWPAAWRARPSD